MQSNTGPASGSRVSPLPVSEMNAGPMDHGRTPRTSFNAPTTPPLTVFTIGHSTRAIEDFIQALQTHGVTRIVDVRTIPRSRHNPQFDQDCLPRSLKEAGISYSQLPDLGGLRHTTRASMNLGWRNESFRGFADYMETPAFEKGIRELMRLAGKDKIALMCAEAVPWSCHRSLIADALLVRGVRVNHIMSPWRYESHTLTSFAKVRGHRVTYPLEAVPRRSRTITAPVDRPPATGKHRGEEALPHPADPLPLSRSGRRHIRGKCQLGLQRRQRSAHAGDGR